MKLSSTLETMANHDDIPKGEYVRAYNRLCFNCFPDFSLIQYIYDVRTEVLNREL